MFLLPCIAKAWGTLEEIWHSGFLYFLRFHITSCVLLSALRVPKNHTPNSSLWESRLWSWVYRLLGSELPNEWFLSDWSPLQLSCLYPCSGRTLLVLITLLVNETLKTTEEKYATNNAFSQAAVMPTLNPSAWKVETGRWSLNQPGLLSKFQTAWATQRSPVWKKQTKRLREQFWVECSELEV